MALLGYPRGNRVPGETWMPKHPSLTAELILTLEPSVSTIPRPNDSDVERFPETVQALKLAVGFTCWALNSSPFFHRVRTMAAILRAKVSRAISGCIPLANKPR